MPRLTASLDVQVSSSLTEALPNVVGEAMACGVPCAVTDVGDSALLVGDTGRVVPPQDPAALAQACIDLVEQSSGRERRSKHAAGVTSSSIFRLIGWYRDILSCGVKWPAAPSSDALGPKPPSKEKPHEHPAVSWRFGSRGSHLPRASAAAAQRGAARDARNVQAARSFAVRDPRRLPRPRTSHRRTGAARHPLACDSPARSGDSPAARLASLSRAAHVVSRVSLRHRPYPFVQAGYSGARGRAPSRCARHRPSHPRLRVSRLQSSPPAFPLQPAGAMGRALLRPRAVRQSRGTPALDSPWLAAGREMPDDLQRRRPGRHHSPGPRGRSRCRSGPLATRRRRSRHRLRGPVGTAKAATGAGRHRRRACASLAPPPAGG